MSAVVQVASVDVLEDGKVLVVSLSGEEHGVKVGRSAVLAYRLIMQQTPDQVSVQPSAQCVARCGIEPEAVLGLAGRPTACEVGSCCSMRTLSSTPHSLLHHQPCPLPLSARFCFSRCSCSTPCSPAPSPPCCPPPAPPAAPQHAVSRLRFPRAAVKGQRESFAAPGHVRRRRDANEQPLLDETLSITPETMAAPAAEAESREGSCTCHAHSLNLNLKRSRKGSSCKGGADAHAGVE
jgi:hypothetical protein